MSTKFASGLKNLYQLTGEIGTLAEDDPRYEPIYEALNDALDHAEEQGLIQYTEELDEEAE